MKITLDELATNYGINLTEYSQDNCEMAIITIAYEQAITRILNLNDTIANENELLNYITEKGLENAFKKLQFQIIYNMLFIGDNDPININVDRIICSDLRLGAINSWQKQLYRR